jgi:hypothetical protein
VAAIFLFPLLLDLILLQANEALNAAAAVWFSSLSFNRDCCGMRRLS